MMGHPVHIEVDRLSWFAGYGPLQEIGRCRHICEHRHTAVICWGPDLDRYELIECSECGCRSWEGQEREGPEAKYSANDWRECADPSGQLPRKDKTFRLAPRYDILAKGVSSAGTAEGMCVSHGVYRGTCDACAVASASPVRPLGPDEVKPCGLGTAHFAHRWGPNSSWLCYGVDAQVDPAVGSPDTDTHGTAGARNQGATGAMPWSERGVESEGTSGRESRPGSTSSEPVASAEAIHELNAPQRLREWAADTEPSGERAPDAEIKRLRGRLGRARDLLRAVAWADEQGGALMDHEQSLVRAWLMADEAHERAAHTEGLEPGGDNATRGETGHESGSASVSDTQPGSVTTEAPAPAGGMDQSRHERFPSGSSTVPASNDGSEGENHGGVASSGPSEARTYDAAGDPLRSGVCQTDAHERCAFVHCACSCHKDQTWDPIYSCWKSDTGQGAADLSMHGAGGDTVKLSEVEGRVTAPTNWPFTDPDFDEPAEGQGTDEREHPIQRRVRTLEATLDALLEHLATDYREATGYHHLSEKHGGCDGCGMVWPCPVEKARVVLEGRRPPFTRSADGPSDDPGYDPAALRAAILDIDAHATPFGDDKDGFIERYLLTAGALHRALGLIGHTAPPCKPCLAGDGPTPDAGYPLNTFLHELWGVDPCDTACTHVIRTQEPQLNGWTLLGLANVLRRAAQRATAGSNTHAGTDVT